MPKFAVVAGAEFQMRVLDSLREAKIGVREIVRVYPPYSNDDNIEFCYLTTGGLPQTIYVDANAKIVQGPFKGFGSEEAA